MPSDPRPTSPHLSIYKWQITSVLSITHRLTGLALVAGSALLVGWLWVAAYAPGYYPQLHECLSSTLGQVVLLGWMVAFYYHLANGIRHLFWDMGKGFSNGQVEATGWLVILFTAGLTLFTWGFVREAVGG